MLKEIWIRYKSIVYYGIFGVLTTIVNILVYVLCYDGIGLSNVLSNILAWIAAVSVAFITNKVWVFGSKEFKADTLLAEIWRFAGSRVATGLLDLGIMYVGIDRMHGPSTIIKVFSNIVVIVLNYVLSRFIFRQKKI